MTGVLDLVEKIFVWIFFRKGDLYYEILSTIYPVLSFHQGPKQIQQCFYVFLCYLEKKIGFA